MDMIAPYVPVNRIELVVVIGDCHGVLNGVGKDHAITLQR